ncbi:hypothetical protein ACJX0J_032030, partial [Zea mays]
VYDKLNNGWKEDKIRGIVEFGRSKVSLCTSKVEMGWKSENGIITFEFTRPLNPSCTGKYSGIAIIGAHLGLNAVGAFSYRCCATCIICDTALAILFAIDIYRGKELIEVNDMISEKNMGIFGGFPYKNDRQHKSFYMYRGSTVLLQVFDYKNVSIFNKSQRSRLWIFWTS